MDETDAVAPRNAGVDVVLAWHEALNAGDLDRLAALVDEEVEVVGPRGSGRGVALLHDWAARAGVRLEPGRVFQRDEAVVVEQRATWRDATGQAGEPQTVASAFLVRDVLVRRVARYDDVGTALAATEMEESDEVQPAR